MIDELQLLVNSNHNKTLDVQIEEMREYLSSYTISASDEVAKTINTSEFTVTASSYFPNGVSIETSGTLKVSLITKYSTSSRTVTVYKNGSAATTITISGTTSGNDQTVVSMNISVAVGDVITFKNTSSTSIVVRASGFNILGTYIPLAQQNLIQLI